jgi:hypothetical protein
MSVFTVLINDASYKHSVALARYIRRSLPELRLVGHDSRERSLSRFYSCFDETVAGQPLSAILERGSFDMLLPVGAESVKTAARACPDRCLLPPQESLTACFDKWKTLQLAADIGVPAPRSYLVTCQKDLSSVDLEFPCVVKASREDSANKSVAYPASRSELLQVAGDLLRDSSGEPILVQEFVRGCGCGLFALYDHGRPVRVFMHRRLREFPPSGGVSTAARAVFSEQLKEYDLVCSPLFVGTA